MASKIDLDNLGIRKDVVKKNKRVDETLNDKEVGLESNTRIVDIVEDPDQSDSVILSQFAGLIGKFGDTSQTVVKQLNEEEKERVSSLALGDSLKELKLSEEQFNSQTGPLSDYKQYLKEHSKFIGLNSSLSFSQKTISSIDENITEKESYVKNYDIKFNKKMSDITTSHENGDLSDVEYTNITNSFYNQRRTDLNSLENKDINVIKKDNKNKLKIIFNSKDSKEQKIKRINALGYKQLKSEELLYNSETESYTTIKSKEMVSDFTKTIDNFLSLQIDGDINAEKKANENYDLMIEGVSDDKSIDSKVRIKLIDKLNLQKDKVLKKYKLREDESSLEMDKSNINSYVNDEFESNSTTTKDFTNSLNFVVTQGISNSNMGKKEQLFVSETLNIIRSKNDIDSLNELKKVNNKNGDNLYEKYRKDFDIIENNIERINLSELKNKTNRNLNSFNAVEKAALEDVVEKDLTSNEIDLKNIKEVNKYAETISEEFKIKNDNFLYAKILEIAKNKEVKDFTIDSIKDNRGNVDNLVSEKGFDKKIIMKVSSVDTNEKSEFFYNEFGKMSPKEQQNQVNVIKQNVDFMNGDTKGVKLFTDISSRLTNGDYYDLNKEGKKVFNSNLFRKDTEYFKMLKDSGINTFNEDNDNINVIEISNHVSANNTELTSEESYIKALELSKTDLVKNFIDKLKEDTKLKEDITKKLLGVTPNSSDYLMKKLAIQNEISNISSSNVSNFFDRTLNNKEFYGDYGEFLSFDNDDIPSVDGKKFILGRNINRVDFNNNLHTFEDYYGSKILIRQTGSVNAPVYSLYDKDDVDSGNAIFIFKKLSDLEYKNANSIKKEKLDTNYKVISTINKMKNLR